MKINLRRMEKYILMLAKQNWGLTIGRRLLVTMEQETVLPKKSLVLYECLSGK
jgi:hypothetical protein